ncbi:hypothetical protein ACIQ2D_10120 [Lysinibacillus sp. NPDC097287]|uniref:hypothetical protein n=1 Tax=Lysinibacillus sp. NPDC097287 TaxID=3364144 RepID=UPI0037FDFE78
MSNIYMVSIKEETDGQEGEQKVKEIVFAKKSGLKEFLQKEGYSKESQNLYVKISEESIIVAEIEKVKI